MDDWVFLDDGTLSHSEEEVTISCSTDPSDLVIAVSSSSSDENEDTSSKESDCSSDDGDADGNGYMSEASSEYSDQMADDVFECALVPSPKLEKINRIAHLVLPRLPAKSLLRFKSVSPNFNDLISSPFMVLSHLLQAKTISGLFYRTEWNKTCYLSFDAPSTDLPDPSLSYLPEPVVIKASTHGLLCVIGLESLKFYITNPTTMEWVEIPDSAGEYDDNVAVVIVFDEPSVYNFSGDYRVVCACPVKGLELEGVYTFKTFSSDKWAWTQSEEVCEVENIVAESGTAVGAVAYWRTTMETLLSYDPVKDRSHIMQRPHAEMDEVWWELGEMDGQLGVTSKTSAGDILVSTMVKNKGEEQDWKEMGNFLLSENTNAAAIRSQGLAKLVLWEERTNAKGFAKGLVLRDMQGQQKHRFAEPNEFTAFVPYIGTLVPVKRPGAGTSTETLVKSSGILLPGAIGNIGEEASKLVGK